MPPEDTQEAKQPDIEPKQSPEREIVTPATAEIVEDQGRQSSKSSTEGHDGFFSSDIPAEFQQMMMATFQGTTRPNNPLLEKMTEAHVDKYLDYLQRDDDFEHKYKASNRWFYLVYVVIAVIVLGALVIFLLPKDRDLLNDIIQIIVAFAGGVGSGFGIKSWQDNR